MGFLVFWFLFFVLPDLICMLPCACLVPAEASEGTVRSPGAGFIGDCERHVGAGN